MIYIKAMLPEPPAPLPAPQNDLARVQLQHEVLCNTVLVKYYPLIPGCVQSPLLQ